MVSFTSELFEFNKMMLIYFFTACITFLWIIKMILSKKIIVKKTLFDIPIVLFLASQIISFVFSMDRHTSLFGYYGRFNGGLLSLFAYVLLYYSAVSNLTKAIVHRLLKISLLSSFVVIVWGLPGRLGYDLSCFVFTGQLNNSCWTDQFRPAERMFSTLGQPNWLGAYLAVNFFIGLYYFFKHRSRESNAALDDTRADSGQDRMTQILVGIYLLLNFSSILFTRSRSALAAVTICLALFFVNLLFRNRDFFKIHFKKIFTLVLTLGISLLLFKTGIDQVDRFISLSSYRKAIISTLPRRQAGDSVAKRPRQQSAESGVTESGDIRKVVWQGAIDLGLRYPLFGTGVETFAYSYYFVRPKSHNLTSEWDYLYNKAHNEYLNYFATTGFFGVMSYLVLIFSILFYAWSKIKNQKSKIKIEIQNSKLQRDDATTQITNNQLLITALLFSHLTMLITNFFGFSTSTINLYFYLIPAFLIILSRPDESTLADSKIFLSLKQFGLACLTGICFLLTIWYLIAYYSADVLYAKGDSLTKVNQYQLAAQSLNQALTTRYDHVYADKLSYVLANLALAASYQKESGTSRSLLELSEKLSQKTLKDSPKNVLYWKTMAKNEYLFYQIDLKKDDLDKGISALERARELSPTDPKIPYSMAIFYSLLEDTVQNPDEKAMQQELSLEAIDNSIELKSNYRDAYYLKGQLLKKAGKIEEARKSFLYILQNLDPNDQESKKELQ